MAEHTSQPGYKESSWTSGAGGPASGGVRAACTQPRRLGNSLPATLFDSLEAWAPRQFDWASFEAGIKAGNTARRGAAESLPQDFRNAIRINLARGHLAAWLRVNPGRPVNGPVGIHAEPSTGLSSAHISPRTSRDAWHDELTAEYNATMTRRGKLLDGFESRFLAMATQERQTVTVATGGNYVCYKDPMPWGAKTSMPEVKRGRVVEFSAHSQHRLLSRCNQVNRDLIKAERVWFVTLTYPGAWPADPEVWKAHLDAWRKRLERKYGKLPAIWKLEPQDRGAPHFHLLLFVSAAMADGLRCLGLGRKKRRRWKGGQLASFRAWLAQSWADVVNSGDERHERAGTQCDPLQSWRGVIRYASVYLGKATCFVDRQTGECKPVGRFWGIWHQSHLIKLERFSVPRYAWFRTARALLRTAACRGLRQRSGSRTLFAESALALRLLKLAYGNLGAILWTRWYRQKLGRWRPTEPPDYIDNEGCPGWTDHEWEALEEG